jgi:hypothetical protein
MKITKALLATLTLLALCARPAGASPEYINYQGLLKGADGNPLTSGNYVMEFNVFGSAQGADKIWGPYLADGVNATGHGTEVAVSEGLFNVIMGPQDTAGRSLSAAFTNTMRFIEITVGAGGSPILPRQQFLSNPFAFHADTAGALQSPGERPAVTLDGTNVAVVGAAGIGAALSVAGDAGIGGQLAVTGTVAALQNLEVTGSLGVGASPAAKLDVRGDIKLGPSGQYFAPGGQETLRIVRGKVNADGTPRAGSGFTSVRTGTGIYTVTFNPAFAGEYSVTFTPDWYRVYASTDNVSNESFQANFLNQNVGFENTAFDFIAIGPR